MDFIAIDFETANQHASSACSVGIAIVENNRIVSVTSKLISPVPHYYDAWNTQIHGIDQTHTQNAQTFMQVWQALELDLNTMPLVAHNADFDIGVIIAAFKAYQMPLPTFHYLCSLRLCRRAFPKLKSYSLNNLCDYFFIDFLHHDAAEDAYACAQLMLKVLEKHPHLSYPALCQTLGITPGFLAATQHQPCRSLPKRKTAQR